MSDDSKNEHVLNQTKELPHIDLTALRASVILSLSFRKYLEVREHSLSLLK